MPAAATLNSTNVRNSLMLAWNRMHLTLTSVLAPEKAVDAAARLFATPPRHAHTARELELLATAQRFDVVADDGKLAAWRFGDKKRPTVIVSHGWGGRGAQFRAFVPALLDAGYQVVVFDHIGHGSSEGDESSLVHFLRDLDAVVAHVEAKGSGVVGLIGHSLGAAAAAAWLNSTRRVMRVVLVAPPTSMERYSGWFARRMGLPEKVRARMQERFERRLGHRWDEFELPQSVRHVKAAALVVHDAGDREVGAASGLALARAWPGARFLRTEGLGHRAILRDPQVVADAVDFIADRVVFSPPPRKGEASAYFEPSPIA
ncbi:MAG TPA: alpha/beta fold hydrolase [Usitatibacter sp.]|nr:alpha/beta fold hydrolase [Usitatibacter sp.]